VKLERLNEDAERRFLLDVDGESMDGLPIEIEVVPKALTLRG
jgi:diacylglycerol kinase family enzyme